MPFSISTKFSTILASPNPYSSNGGFLFVRKLYAVSVYFRKKIERKYEGKNRCIPRQNTNYKLFELYSGWVSGKRRD
jgi:hypothetical protein